MSIYVVRHGETDMGRREVIANIKEPLNKYGVQQALMLGKEIRSIPLLKIYCSPMQRARDTLHYFNINNVEIVIEPRINERDMGEYENIPFNRLNWDQFWNYNSELYYPNCESMKHVYERVEEFLDEALKTIHKDQNILICTHGGITRAIDWYFNGIPEDGKAANLNGNCKLYKYR